MAFEYNIKPAKSVFGADNTAVSDCARTTLHNDKAVVGGHLGHDLVRFEELSRLLVARTNQHVHDAALSGHHGCVALCKRLRLGTVCKITKSDIRYFSDNTVRCWLRVVTKCCQDGTTANASTAEMVLALRNSPNDSAIRSSSSHGMPNRSIALRASVSAAVYNCMRATLRCSSCAGGNREMSGYTSGFSSGGMSIHVNVLPVFSSATFAACTMGCSWICPWTTSCVLNFTLHKHQCQVQHNLVHVCNIPSRALAARLQQGT